MFNTHGMDVVSACLTLEGLPGSKSSPTPPARRFSWALRISFGKDMLGLFLLWVCVRAATW